MCAATQLGALGREICRVTVGPVPIHKVTFQQAIGLIGSRVGQRGSTKPFLVVPINAQLVVLADCESRFAKLTTEANLCVADGVSTLIASRFMGDPLPERIAGVDLMLRICEVGSREQIRIYLIGGRPGAAAKTADLLEKRNPGLRIVGTCCPPLGFSSDLEYSRRICEQIRDSQPDVLFVAFGAPKQEYWMQENAHLLGAKVIMAVGGSFDFVAGYTRRAPQWLQNAGLEWLFRVAVEPKRLWKRYFFGNVQFCWLIIRQFLNRQYT